MVRDTRCSAGLSRNPSEELAPTRWSRGLERLKDARIRTARVSGKPGYQREGPAQPLLSAADIVPSSGLKDLYRSRLALNEALDKSREALRCGAGCSPHLCNATVAVIRDRRL